MFDFDLSKLMLLAQQAKNPAIADALQRVQGVCDRKQAVSYYGSLKKMAFFSRRGRFLALPDEGALSSLQPCKTMDGPDEAWSALVGLD